MRKTIGWALAGVMALAVAVRASYIVYNAKLADEAALTYDNTYTLDLQSAGIGSLSAQAVYSSATVPAASFGDGAQAQGTVTVADYTALTAARATNNITVVSTTGIEGTAIIVPGHVLQYGIDWTNTGTASGTAQSLASALSAAVPSLSVNVVGNVIYATAPAGAYYNSMSLVSTNPSVVTAAHATFQGGRDAATLRVNGTVLTQGVQWTAATSNDATASSLATAITNAVGSYLTATPSTNSIALLSKKNGALYNFSLASSDPTNLTISGATMTGGQTSALTLGSGRINLPNHGLSTGLQVLYSASAGGVVGGLTNQTTYYASPIDANTLGLSTSLVNAQAGTFVTVTSSQTGTSAHTFTLTPLPIAGTPGFYWQVSNDNSNWYNLQTSSVSFASPYTAGNTFWSFGYIGARYLRLNVAKPTAGGLKLQVTVIGTN